MFFKQYKHFLYLCHILFDCHLSNLLLDSTKLVDGATKLCAIDCVIHRFLDAVFHGPTECGCHPKPTIVQDVHGHFESTTFACK